MSTDRLVAVGDSVMWGQGLHHHDKFASIVSEAVTGNPLPESDILARSGAKIGFDTRGTPLDIGDKTSRHEVPFTTPAIHEQIELISAPETVDIILLNGGINDIGLGTILDPDTEHTELEELAEQYCYNDMKTLLRDTRTRLPNAIIVVAGYYPILSHASRITSIVAHAGGLVTALAGTPIPLLVGTVTAAVAELVIANAEFSHRQMLYSQRCAVMECAGDPSIRGPGILFAHPGFGAENALFADNPYVYSIGDKGDPSIRQSRESGCEEAYAAGRITSFDREKCKNAPTGHPNPAGARRYATRIIDTHRRYSKVSLVQFGAELTGGRGTVSTRTALERYSLPPVDGVRTSVSNTAVDCLRLTIKTGDEGTDSDVELMFGDHRWNLDTGFYDNPDDSNNFESDATDSFVIDPWLDSDHGTPSAPFSLGDVEAVKLVKDQGWTVGGLIEDVWVVDRIEFDVNGRVVSVIGRRRFKGDDSRSLLYPAPLSVD